MNRIFTTFFMIALSLACMAEDRTHRVKYGAQNSDEAMRAGDIFDWQSKGPMEFLDFLKKQYEQWPKVSSFYTVWGEHYDWIKAEDIPLLFEMASDPTPCQSVLSTASSTDLTAESSTVGHEALYLIAGYKAGVYPTELNSTKWEGNTEQLRQWWEQERNLTRQHKKATFGFPVGIEVVGIDEAVSA